MVHGTVWYNGGEDMAAKGYYVYLQLCVHLQVDVLDVLQLVSKTDDGILLMVDVFLQQFHGHLHLSLHTFLYRASKRERKKKGEALNLALFFKVTII